MVPQPCSGYEPLLDGSVSKELHTGAMPGFCLPALVFALPCLQGLPCVLDPWLNQLLSLDLSCSLLVHLAPFTEAVPE